MNFNAARAVVVLSVLCTSILNASLAQSEEQAQSHKKKEIIVTAGRLGGTEEQIGSSITIVSSEQIEAGQYRTVTDVLEQVAGIDIVKSGGPGGNTALFMRGANSEHTLVLLDGIELNNPATPSRFFNLANLTLENIERIEVLRGAQSTIYGSDAMGGVINIITKKAGKGVAASVSSEAGSYNTFNQVGTAGYGSDAVNVSAGITRQDVGGVSAADANDGNKEDDGYGNTSLTAQGEFTPREFLVVKATTRYVRSNADLDNTGGAGGDDPNRFLDSRELFSRAEASTFFLDKSLSQTIGFSYTNHSLHDDNDPDNASVGFQRSAYEGDLQRLDFQNRWDATDWFSFVVGAQTERERASSEFLSDGEFGPFEDNLSGQSVRTNSYFAETRFTGAEKLFLDAGIRVDDHATFGSETTFRITPAWTPVNGTKLRGSVGTGFKAPSLVQLYSSFGNPELDPEESVGWDVGFDQVIVKDLLSTSLTYFDNDFDNLVTFNPSTFIVENIANAKTSGIEAGVTLSPLDEVELRATYTYTDTEDEATGLSLLRRPRHKGALAASYSPIEKLKLHGQWRAFGSRADNDFSSFEPVRISLGGYSLVDLAASYELSEQIELFTRVENIFDKEYQEVLGYGTLGLAAYGGFKVSL